MSNRQAHRKNKPQRDRSHKRYKPKHIHLPVMQGLRNEFSLVLHSALTAAELGHFSKHQYDRIGQAINCIWGALELRPLKDSAAAKLVIEGAMRAMNDAGRRGDATDIWVLRETEQVAVLAGIQKAEEILPRLDVFTLHEAIQRMKLMQIEEERDASRIHFVASNQGKHNLKGKQHEHRDYFWRKRLWEELDAEVAIDIEAKAAAQGFGLVTGGAR